MRFIQPVFDLTYYYILTYSLQVKGAADPINSAFRLTYNMVLNLLRVEEVNPEYMMERSFFQFQNYSNIPKLYKGKHHDVTVDSKTISSVFVYIICHKIIVLLKHYSNKKALSGVKYELYQYDGTYLRRRKIGFVRTTYVIYVVPLIMNSYLILF